VEYAFSTLKVVAIVVFILLGGWAVAGTGFANFTNHGGFLPHGAWGLWEPSGATQRAFRSTVARLVNLLSVDAHRCCGAVDGVGQNHKPVR